MAGKEDQTVIGAERLAICELIHVSSALETEYLEYLEGRVGGQTVDVHLAGLLYNVVRVVLLIDGHGDTVGSVGHLSYGVDDKSVVLLAVIGCDDVEPVANVKKSCKIILVCGLVALGQIFSAKLVSKSVKRCCAFFAESGLDSYVVFGVSDILAAFQHPLHNLCGEGSPASVLDEGNGSVAEVALCQVAYKFAHKGEDLGVICCGGENELVVSECFSNCQRHIASCQIVDLYLGSAVRLQLFSELENCFLCVSVNRRVSDDDTLVLAADTLVTLDGAFLGKPRDEADARRMIEALQGRIHAVAGGICLWYRGRTVTASELTRVTFAPMSEADVAAYLATGESFGKAGGYAIQGYASRFISGIEGDYFNVVGLPVHRLFKTLAEEFGIQL